MFIGSAKIITELSLIPENRQTPFPGSGREFSLLSFSCFVALVARGMVVFICVPEPSKTGTCNAYASPTRTSQYGIYFLPIKRSQKEGGEQTMSAFIVQDKTINSIFNRLVHEVSIKCLFQQLAGGAVNKCTLPSKPSMKITCQFSSRYV